MEDEEEKRIERMWSRMKLPCKKRRMMAWWRWGIAVGGGFVNAIYGRQKRGEGGVVILIGSFYGSAFDLIGWNCTPNYNNDDFDRANSRF